MLSKKSSKLKLAIIVFFALTTRLVGLFWGKGYFFHPDENNMATSIANMTADLHPHFFAYGQFSLYLAYFLIKIFNISHNFANSVYALRLLSAFFSLATVVILYHISKFFLSSKQSYLFTLLIIFCPGLIQLAHFGTTESLLILVFCIQILLAIQYYHHQSSLYFLLSILVSAIGLATKISSLLLITPFFLSLLLKSQKIYIFFLSLMTHLLLSVVISLVLSPYNILDWSAFRSALGYETSVATGQTKVFYTRQFNDTIPYLFQFLRIFPFVSGLPVFILSLITLFKLPKLITKKNRPIYLFIFLPSLVYFLYFGSLYVKWTRFMSPLFFLFPLLATITLSSLSPKLKKIFTLLSILPAFIILSVYTQTDIRLTFSSWFNQNIPSQAIVLSEAGNTINIPFSGQYQITNFDFYQLDNDPNLQSKITSHIAESDYIIIPSRRIFANQLNQNYPHSQSYYQNLFNGNFGFKHLKSFNSTPFDFIAERAEETWTVFDRPIIRLYEKQK